MVGILSNYFSIIRERTGLYGLKLIDFSLILLDQTTSPNGLMEGLQGSEVKSRESQYLSIFSARIYVLGVMLVFLIPSSTIQSDVCSVLRYLLSLVLIFDSFLT